ncbi:MAG TPA: EamA family transporter [Steroidobacteraceae bacterium]|jgi:drug/metabolite transporter (DMT)-like permease
MARSQTTATLLAFAAIYIIWGTTFLGISLMLRTLPAFIGGGMRFLSASLLMYAWLRWREPRPFAGLALGGTALCGVLLTGMGNGFLIWAQLALPSGIAAVFVGSLPVWIVLLDWRFFARRAPRALASVGVLLGLAGIVVLSLNTQGLSGHVRPIHVIAVLVTELAWALGTLLQPRYAPASRVINFTCLQMLVGAGFQFAMAVIDREWRGFSPAHASLLSWGALAYLSVFGSIIAFSSYAFLVSHVAPQKIATYALVNPVIALALGAVVLHERITQPAVISMVLVLLGVTLVLVQRERTRPAPGSPPLVAAGRAEP